MIVIMHLSFVSPWVDPQDTPLGTHRKPGGMVQFWYFFFPAGKESCLVLETTLLDHGYIPMGFV